MIPGSAVLRFDAPAKVWSTNERLHWSKAAELRREWRTAGWVYGLKLTRPRPPGAVQVTLPFRDRRRRDPHNYVGTVVKSIIDGLVDAGVWPDDTPEYVSVLEPVIEVGPQAQVVVRIIPRSQ